MSNAALIIIVQLKEQNSETTKTNFPKKIKQMFEQ